MNRHFLKQNMNNIIMNINHISSKYQVTYIQTNDLLKYNTFLVKYIYFEFHFNPLI